MSKRKDLSLAEKVQVLQALDLKRSQTSIAREFGVSQSQVSRTARNSQDIWERYNRNENVDRKRRREGKAEDVENALYDWFVKAKKTDLPITGPILIEKAKELAKQLGMTHFDPSRGWLQRWKVRHNICVQKHQGKRKEIQTDSVETWNQNTWSSITSRYNLDEIYSCEETGLLFRAVPERLGCKSLGDRLTVLLCSNMTGSEKLKPFVLGQSKVPASVNISSLPVEYIMNTNSLMTKNIFSEWLKELEKKMKQEQRKMCLILENCVAHLSDRRVSNIELVYLPPGTTNAKPFKQGIIRQFKQNYRSEIISRIICLIETNPGITQVDLAEEINLLDALHMINSAWLQVKEWTIVNSFSKAQVGVCHSGIDSIINVCPHGFMSAEEFTNYVDVDSALNCVCSEHDVETDDLHQNVFLTIKHETTFCNPPDECAPTARQALEACKLIRRFYEFKGIGDLTSYYDVENSVRSSVVSTVQQNMMEKLSLDIT